MGTYSIVEEHFFFNIFFSPGIVATDFHDRSGVGEKNVIDHAETAVPLHRAGRAEEQAQLVVNIASPQNTYMTGTIILNDGGLLLA